MGILDNFKKFTETNPESLNILRPELGFIEWNEINHEEKLAIWKNLSGLFFDLKEGHNGYDFDSSFLYPHQKEKIIALSIIEFNNENKKANLCKSFLNTKGTDSEKKGCCRDFIELFFEGKKEIFYEIITIYIKRIIEEYIPIYVNSIDGESKEDENKRLVKIQLKSSNIILNYLDHTFLQFKLKYKLTLNGLIPRQEEYIMENSYQPTIELLGNKKWKEVSIELGKAFQEYQKGNYTDCIRECVNTIEGFLQIFIYGKKIGKQGLKEHYKEAIKQELIKEDKITKVLTDSFINQLALDRKMKGNSHTSLGEADENDALYMLNLTVNNLQHWIKQSN